MKKWSPLLGVLVLVLAIWYLQRDADQLRQERDALADSLLNQRAAADTLRRLNDTLSERLAFQAARVRVLGDSARRLGAVLATVRVAEVRRETTTVGRATVEVGHITATDSARQGPVTAVAQVTVTLADSSAAWAWQLRQDAFDLTVGLSCASPQRGESRWAPTAAVAGPSWFQPRDLTVTALPRVCNPPRMPVGRRALTVGWVVAGTLVAERLILGLLRGGRP